MPGLAHSGASVDPTEQVCVRVGADGCPAVARIIQSEVAGDPPAAAVSGTINGESRSGVPVLQVHGDVRL